MDCGTNSLRLLVADVDPAAGTLTDVVRRQEVVRLGEGVDRTGRIAPAALARTLATTRRYADEVAELGATAIRFAATSASRDASNRDDFVTGVRDAIGVVPEVLSGAEEAELSFLGATAALAGHHRAPFCVCDLGGGSTEVVLGGEHLTAAWSMDVGSVRLHERHGFADPPTAAQVDAARADVHRALDEAVAHVPVGAAATLVGVAGTVTTITAHALRLDRYDSALVDGAVLGVDETLEACADLLAMPTTLRAALPYLHPGRVDVIGAGALVWAETVTRVRDEVARAGAVLTSVVTSERDILDGLAMSVASSAPG